MKSSSLSEKTAVSLRQAASHQASRGIAPRSEAVAGRFPSFFLLARVTGELEPIPADADRDARFTLLNKNIWAADAQNALPGLRGNLHDLP